MKTLKHIEIKTLDGKVQIDAMSKKELNTSNLIIIALGQSKYSSMSEQWKAYEITKKLEEMKEIELEDSDYELVKSKVMTFEPYLNGFTFVEFMKLFE